MQIKELIEIYEEKHPLSLQENWDNGGVQVGDINQEVKNVLTTLEITPESIEYAIKNNCNLIFSHHPVIFPNISLISQDHFKGKKIINAIKNDIVIYASHTASDVSGFNEFVFEKIGFRNFSKIVPTVDDYGYGNFTKMQMKFSDLLKSLKTNLKLNEIIVYGEKDSYKNIGLLTGSGMDFINEVIKNDIDLYLTADITHHDAMDAMERGITLVDLTHEGSERLFADFAEKEINSDNRLKNVKVYKYYNDKKYLRKLL